jgi:hypothetical protein
MSASGNDVASPPQTSPQSWNPAMLMTAPFSLPPWTGSDDDNEMQWDYSSTELDLAISFMLLPPHYGTTMDENRETAPSPLPDFEPQPELHEMIFLATADSQATTVGIDQADEETRDEPDDEALHSKPAAKRPLDAAMDQPEDEDADRLILDLFQEEAAAEPSLKRARLSDVAPDRAASPPPPIEWIDMVSAAAGLVELTGEPAEADHATPARSWAAIGSTTPSQLALFPGSTPPRFRGRPVAHGESEAPVGLAHEVDPLMDPIQQPLSSPPDLFDSRVARLQEGDEPAGLAAALASSRPTFRRPLPVVAAAAASRTEPTAAAAAAVGATQSGERTSQLRLEPLPREIAAAT